MATARKVLFFVFLVLYLILCPLLVLYSFGYIFNPIKQEMTRTGLIYLSSMPEGADIYFEKSRYREKTPAGIGSLIAGNYKITLKLKGHKPWVHTISVRKGKVSSFKNILLIPKNWPVKNLLPGPYVKLIPAAGADYFLIAKSSNLGSYAAYEWRWKENIPFLREYSPYFNLPVTSVFMEEGSPFFIVHSGALLDNRYLYVKPGKTTADILDITKLIQERPLDIEWNDFNRGKIFTLYRGYINLIDIESGSILPRYVENIKGYGAYLKWLYTLDADNNVFKQTYDKKQKESLVYDSGFRDIFLGKTEFYKIKILEGDTLLFLGRKGQLVTNLSPYNIINRGVRGLEFYKKRPGFLYWTKQSIGVANINKYVRKFLLYNAGANITDCFLINEGTHALFNDNNRVYLIEIEPQKRHHIEFITRVKDNTSFFYSDETGCVYYLEPNKGNLNSIEIFPR